MIPSATGLIWSPGPFRSCVGVVIRSGNAPTNYRFALDMPPETVAEEADDGGLHIVDCDRVTLAAVHPAWAYDAEGNALPASQHRDGDNIVLRVQHQGAAYPVLADPEFDWGWVSGTLYFTREETRTARDAAALAGLVAGSCPHPACRVVAPVAGLLALAAARIYEDGKCLRIRLQPAPTVPPFVAIPLTTRRGGRNCH